MPGGNVLTAGDYRGLYAILPTPTLPTGDIWAQRSTVDVTELARVCEALVSAGTAGIIGLGTTGECATLGSHEYATVVHTVVDAVAGRVPVLLGATALGWADIAQRLDILRDAGVDGTLLGLPMWQPLTEDMAVRMYAEVSRAFPQLTVMVYANERAFRFPFSSSPTFWQRLVEEAPTVSAAKFSRPEAFRQLRPLARDRIRFMPNEMRVLEFLDIASHEEVTSFWATAASMGPEPCLGLMDALEASDTHAAAAVSADIAWANEPVADLIRDQEVFALFNIQIEKARIDAAGYCAAGPVRPPYTELPKEYASRAAECGTRWRKLRVKYLAANRSGAAALDAIRG
jgi:dihydrodipicolinate synthase/N-acetylneuraminate lyase